MILSDTNTKDIHDFYDIDKSQMLGRGTYGTVVIGKVKESTCRRAIKIIPKARVTNMERFLSEISIMRQLDHPNILKLYESFEDPEYVYLVLE